jgi:hypothetical protein
MADFLDPKMNQIVNAEVKKDETEDKLATINLIADNPIDLSALEERAKTWTIEQRLAYLELENERRVKENSVFAYNYRQITLKFFPMILKIYNHFFVDDGK